MRKLKGSGRVIERGDVDFDREVLATSFSGRDPGVRPMVMIQPNNAAEAAAAVRRAVAENLKISICSGGHSWMQNHLRDGGMLIDMGRMNAIEVDKEAMRARVGPGCWSAHLDARLARDGLFFPVAHAPDVGLGGFLLQGGFGWGSRQYGLGCENVVGIDVVLADGREAHASESENADLFWAARGSGPGFFALVTRYHLKLHPRPRAMGMKIQFFRQKHLDDVYRWADAVGGEVADTVEFQMALSPGLYGVKLPMIQVFAPVLTSSFKQARADVDFIHHSPLRKKALFTSPLIPASTMRMSWSAVGALFPPNMRWCVDNMWTEAPIDDLLPGIRRVAETMPPFPSHALWLNWSPSRPRPDMAFSKEAKHYFAVYGEWKRATDDALYENWATQRMAEMAQHSVGVQLADENLGRRPAWFISEPNLAKLDALRARYDPTGRFHAWKGRPDALREAS